MHFEEVFFEGEKREGFYVRPMMKRAWAAQLELLQQIDEVCARNDIEYFADWGTLLGAVRHQGYIPWDDDLDIGMKRKDYERFLNIAPKEFPQDYTILSARYVPDWKGTFSRIVNTNKIPLKKEKLEQFHGFPYSAGIDIFPIDYIPVDKNEEDTQMVLFRAAYTLATDWKKEEMTPEEKMESLREIEKYSNIKFVEEKPYDQQLWFLADRIASMYWDTEAEAKEMTLIYVLADRPECRIPISCFESTMRVPFENSTIPIPVGYDEILKAYYGEDYMTPIQGAADHEYPYYKKQQKTLFQYYEQNGIVIPKYFYE